MTTSEAKRPNVLVIMTDQQNLATLGCYGSPSARTPHIDSLATDGVLFESTYVTTPLCVPSRASIWSARYPHRSGVLLNDDDREIELSDEVETLGDLANASGYACGYIGKWHIGREKLPQHGFNAAWWTQLRGSYEQEIDEAGQHDFTPIDGATPLGRRLSERGQVPFKKAHDTVVTDRTIEFMEAHADGDAPFLAVCSMRAPHDPYIGPFDNAYSPDEVTIPATFDRDPSTLPGHVARTIPRQWFEEMACENGVASEQKLRELTARYWGLVRLVDENVGRLRAALKRLEIERVTIVVFMSDHGDMMGAQGLVSKGNCMFDEATKVPLIMSWPGTLPAGSRVATLASTIDVVPTLLDLMYVAPSPEFDGQTLRQSWDYNFNRRDAVFLQIWETYGMFDPVLAVRTERWKYSWRMAGQDELYDMNADPLETQNLADNSGNADLLRGLRSRIVDWLHATGDIPLSRLAVMNKGFTADF